MNACKESDKRNGFTLIEVLVVIAIITVLIALFLSSFASTRDRSPQVQCMNNLRQLGTAFRLWADDNNGFYPMHYAGNTNYPMLNLATSWLGYTRDYADAHMYFKAMSNELSTPKLLVCSQDKRTAATNFLSLQASNVSYFVGLDAFESNANMLMAGDRNMIVNSNLVEMGLVNVTISDRVVWSTAIHNESGDVTLADGSVQKFSNSQLQRHLSITGTNENRLVFP
jgi:prepilin-type N-terminal cleavage/methylation domain-containing protein